MKKTIAVLLTIATIFSMCSCGKSEEPQTEASSIKEETTENNTKESENLVEQFLNEEMISPLKGDTLPQLNSPKKGDIKVTMKTNKGDIVFCLYPEYAPKACENFVGLCKKGYYDDIIFHRIVKDFMIQGGDPTGTGTAGESVWGGKFDDEISDALHHFTGALCYARSNYNTNGSQFYIVHGNTKATDASEQQTMFYWMYNELQRRVDTVGQKYGSSMNSIIDELNNLLSSAQTKIPDEFHNRYKKAFDAYKEVGGVTSLDYGYTVFGQVIEGMDVVDTIANVAVTDSGSGEKSSPLEEIKIIGTEVGTF